MSTAIACAVCDDVPGTKRLIIQSIGTASPANAASIAIGLGVPVPSVLKALYQAPTVLVDGLTADMAEQMVGLLTDLGCIVEIESQSSPPPEPAPLFDVAVYVKEAARYGQIVTNLSKFLGCDETKAAQLLATPPGMVLGEVSRATVDALAAQLGAGADLVASDPDSACYDLFLGDCDATQRARLMADLKRRGHTPVAESGLILTELDRPTADAIWSAHSRQPALRVVNRDFLRFDVVLLGGATARRHSEHSAMSPEFRIISSHKCFQPFPSR